MNESIFNITLILDLEIILHNLKKNTVLGTRRDRKKGRNIIKHGYSSQETHIHGRDGMTHVL